MKTVETSSHLEVSQNDLDGLPGHDRRRVVYWDGISYKFHQSVGSSAKID